MVLEICGRESSILYELLTENTTDIILKTDRDGFIYHASSAIQHLGIHLPDMLIWPHILDLVDDTFKPTIAACHRAAVNGQQPGNWTEFPSSASHCRKQWYAIRMRNLIDDKGEIYGALSVMRNVEETRVLKESLFAAELTDPLTHLTNRRAFISMLQYLLDCQAKGWLALYDIDYFKAINMRYGHSFGDKVIIAFAEFLRNLTYADSIVSRVGAHRFGILLPETTPSQARSICEEIAIALADVSKSENPAGIPLTVSAGIVPFSHNLDDTMKASELALFLAKVKGRNRIEMAA